MDASRVRAAQRDLYEAGEYAAFSATVRPIAQALVDHAAPKPGDLVLDAGAGDGVVSACVREAGADAVALDVSALQLARARARLPGLPATVGDVERLPFADASFDVVLSNMGAVLAPDVDRAAAELFRVCRPGGLVAVTAWPPDSLMGELAEALRAVVPDPAGFADQELGWGEPATARARFARHASDVTTTRASAVWDLALRGSAGADDFAARYVGRLVAGADLNEVRTSIAARYADGAGNLVADYLLVSGRRRSGSDAEH